MSKKLQYKTVKKYSEVIIPENAFSVFKSYAAEKGDRYLSSCTIVFTTLKIEMGLEPSTQTVPESNAINTNFSDWVCTAVMSNDVMKDLRG